MGEDRRHPARRRGPVLAALVVTLVLAGCGNRYGRSEVAGPTSTPSLGDLDGPAWVTSAIVDPHRDLVPRSELNLTFRHGALSATAGCTTLFGAATVRDGHLVAGPLASTQKGCPAALVAQDTWLAAFLSSHPRIERLDENLWLSRHDTVVHLEQQSG